MDWKAVFLVCLTFSWTQISYQHDTSSTDPNELTSILTTLQERLLQSSCDSLNLVTQVLIREIEARSVQQDRLERRITELQNQRTDVQAGPVIAFSAQVLGHLSDLTIEQTIPFKEIVTNIGGGYIRHNSTFRCPVRGVYQFVVTILSQKNDRIQTKLIAAGVTRMALYSGGTTYHGSGSNSVLVELKAGDEVYVRVNRAFGSELLGVWSTFNGHLVRQLL